MSVTLVINPGSTSTKLAVFDNGSPRFSRTVSHPAEECAAFPKIIDQAPFRLQTILAALAESGVSMEDFAGVIGIGGLLKSVDSGVYEISDAMLEDLRGQKYGEHAANLGAVLVRELSDRYQIPGYVADPITVDEMQAVARVSGHPLLPRYGRTHTLNHKRVAMSAAAELGRSYEDCRLIVAHMGGGVSIGAHAGGRIVDSTTSRGEGAFSMDRSGQLNSWELAKLCFSGKYTKKEVLKMLNGEGGVYAHLGTKDFREVERRMQEGDAAARDVFCGLAYQTAKTIGSMAVVLEGRIDAIVLTGGILYSKAFSETLYKQIQFLGKIILRPGEEEMESLVYYLDAVLSGRIAPKTYI